MTESINLMTQRETEIREALADTPSDLRDPADVAISDLLSIIDTLRCGPDASVSALRWVVMMSVGEREDREEEPVWVFRTEAEASDAVRAANKITRAFVGSRAGRVEWHGDPEASPASTAYRKELAVVGPYDGLFNASRRPWFHSQRACFVDTRRETR